MLKIARDIDMSEISIREMYECLESFFKLNPFLTFVCGTFFALAVSESFGLLPQRRGRLLLISVVLVLTILLLTLRSVMIVIKRNKLPTYKFGDVDERKGLIVSISLLSEQKEVLIDKLNSVKIDEKEGLEELFKIRGVGQTFKALIHHRKTLRTCWLLHTKGSEKGKEVVVHFIDRFCPGVRSKPIFLTNHDDIKSVYNELKKIYTIGLELFNLDETEVIADVTGGTSAISCAITSASYLFGIDIEYIEQSEEANLIKLQLHKS